MSKCKGCGLVLQNTDVDGLGYTPKLTNKLCERCFKITNYNFHDNGKYIDNKQICDEINNKNAFNFFMCDVFSLNEKVINLYNQINSPKVFILTKADLLPSNVDYKKLIDRVKKAYNLEKVLLCSIKNEAGLDDIMSLIRTYQKVLFCGPTSSGKSSLINHLFSYNLTVSSFQNTTQDFISLKNQNDITLIDAPGFIGDVYTSKLSMIKPRTMVIKGGYELVIKDLVLFFDKEVNITLYFPKDISIKTRKMLKQSTNHLRIDAYSDLTIRNLGFIYFKNECNVYLKNNEDVSIRNSIVGGL